jgi:hypothetical protein
MKQYLILAETEETVYFVEIVDDLELALSREKLFFELAFNSPTDHKRMREEFKPLGTYTIGTENALTENALSGSSNGFSATYVLEIDENFNFENFATSRNS